MKNLLKYLAIALTVASLALSTAAATSSTGSMQSNNLSVAMNFLSNVVGLNLTEYSLTTPSYLTNVTLPDSNPTAPPNTTFTDPFSMNGLNIETPSYYFKSDNGTIDALCIFYNGQLALVNIDPIGTNVSYDYASPPGNDLASQADAILTKYAGFLSQESSVDTSFLPTMTAVLNSVNIEQSVNVTAGNINFLSSQNGDVATLKWIYTENGVCMNYKRVEMDFTNGALTSFSDGWSLYKVAGLSEITAQQATNIALHAAQNVQLVMTTSNGQNVTVATPDLSNAPYDSLLNMMPIHGADPSLTSQLNLDPLTLYPVWQFQFYFNQTTAGDDGIDVGVLGTTSTVLYANGFGHLGDLPTTTTGTSSDSLDLAIVIVFVVVAALMICIPLALRKKIRRR